jgi:hypothetical protein
MSAESRRFGPAASPVFDHEIGQPSTLANADAIAYEREGERRLRALQGLAALTAVLFSVSIVWLAPKPGPGMTMHDYNVRTMTMVALLVALVVVAAVMSWYASRFLSNEPKSELMRVLVGQPLHVRSAKRFIDRLKFECARARNARATFSLLVVDITPPRDAELRSLMSDVVRALREKVRHLDVVGDSGESEIWILAPGADARAVTYLVRRISQEITHGILAPGGTARCGWSTFGVDGREADALLQRARRSFDLHTVSADVAADANTA